MSNLEELDVALFRKINSDWSVPFLDPFFVWLTDPPYRLVLLIATWGLLMVTRGRDGRRAGWMLLFAVLLADQLSATLVKPLLDRVRPCFALPEVRLLLPKQAHSPSFPSSHAANTFAVATVLYPLGGLWRWTALAVAVLASYSRIYVGVHYPSDLLGGAILGVALGCLTLAAERPLRTLWAYFRKVLAATRTGEPDRAPGRKPGFARRLLRKGPGPGPGPSEPPP